MKNYIVHNNQVISNKTKIKLIKMDDPYHPVPSGTVGVVDTIDDMRQIHMLVLMKQLLCWRNTLHLKMKE